MIKTNKLPLIILGWLMLFSLNASAQTYLQKGVYINKVPLENFVTYITEKKKKGVDLTKSFSVEIKGDLTNEGKFDHSNTKVLKTVGDEDIVDIALTAIEAVEASGFLKYLSDIEIKNINLVVVQNESSLSIRVISDMKSPELAKTVTSGLNSAVSMAKYMKKSEVAGGERDEIKRQNEEDQLFLINNTYVTSEVTDFILQIRLPKTEAHKIIKRNLENK